MRGRVLLALLAVTLASCGDSNGHSSSAPAAAPRAPANRVVHVPVGGNPAAITSGFGRVWTVGHRNGQVYVIDPATARVTNRIALGGTSYTGLAAGLGAIWVFRDDTQTLVKIDPKTLRVVGTSRPGTTLTALTPVGGMLWAVAPEMQALVALDPATTKIVKRAKVPAKLASGDLTSPSEDRGAFWIGGYQGLAKIDPENGRVLKSVRAGDQVGAVAATPSGVYFVYPNSTQLMRLSPNATRPTRVGRGSPQPGLMQRVGDNVILMDGGHPDVVRFDAATAKPIARLRLRGDVKLAPGQFAETTGLTGVAGTSDALWFSDWAANAVHRVPLTKLGG